MPKTYKLQGSEVEMYSIGELAKMLGRDAQTVRKWEKTSVIPKAGYRDATGRRLYTKRQVEIITTIAEEEGIRQGVSFEKTKFVERVYEAFKQNANKV